MTRYQLKDKKRQAQLDALCDENKFSERLDASSEAQFHDAKDYVYVEFGKKKIL